MRNLRPDIPPGFTVRVCVGICVCVCNVGVHVCVLHFHFGDGGERREGERRLNGYTTLHLNVRNGKCCGPNYVDC